MTEEMITREEARARGLRLYYSGRPCPHGHVGNRLVRNCACHECQRVLDLLRKRRKAAERRAAERKAAQRRALPQIAVYSDFIAPPTLAQLMAGH